MPRLIWVFAGCTLNLLVLSCLGSNTCCCSILLTAEIICYADWLFLFSNLSTHDWIWQKVIEVFLLYFDLWIYYNNKFRHLSVSFNLSVRIWLLNRHLTAWTNTVYIKLGKDHHDSLLCAVYCCMLLLKSERKILIENIQLWYYYDTSNLYKLFTWHSCRSDRK